MALDAAAPAPTPVTASAAAAAAGFGVEIPFVSHLGLRLHSAGDGASELHYQALPEHLNSFDLTHGGALMSLLDVAMAMAIRGDDAELGALTVEMKTTFMQGARGPLVARGKLLHRTRSLAFAEASVFDAQGQLCCHSTGTFKPVRRPAMPEPPAEG